MVSWVHHYTLHTLTWSQPSTPLADNQALWKTIRGVGVPEILINLIKDLHKGTHSQVRVGRQLSPPFLTEFGVRQGCVLAPSLFCRAVDWVLNESLHPSGLTVFRWTILGYRLCIRHSSGGREHVEPDRNPRAHGIRMLRPRTAYFLDEN